MRIDRKDDRVIITHDKGASTEILLYGATVISWKSGTKNSSEPVEHLFVSKKAVLDGSKPVRGGIPVVFPCFGPPVHAQHSRLSQHGFARSELWKWGKVVADTETEVTVQLTLDPTASITAKYDRPFHLAFVVRLTEYQLDTELHVKNTSDSDELEFQALFHNYIRAPSSEVLIFPLQHQSYYDKTAPNEEERSTLKEEFRAGVDVKRFTDFVYENASQKYEVIWPQGKIGIKATALKDVVVWNPQETGSKIADMEDGGWERFVCVEPGYVRGFAKVGPGESWLGSQSLSVIHDKWTHL